MLAITQHGHSADDPSADALPYWDVLSAEEKVVVDRLVEEEMRRSKKTPEDYLRELPPLPASRLEASSLVEGEVVRAAAGQPMPSLETKRYNLDPPPPTKRNDVNAWREALANAHSQLEHQHSRLLNLELLLKFGPDAWRMHNEGLSSLTTRLQGELADARAAIDRLNRERKLQQTAAGREIANLEAEYLELVRKNQAIDVGCRQVEQSIAALQAASDRQGGTEQLPAPADGEAQQQPEPNGMEEGA